ncbi:uncharacterized protein C8R40DRAFT_23757 [Lentinula edodes]|uniref:uncharacterized protein n=1 Tax=Lentinula edodes TaxID=5353 RepID=UPI001E8DFE7A|nr:uncharacterized protein C8R40DRAFT_23757 [Lentinula edodes]KAH7881184.1 hypothetical protein C8R40DRAFT_23757 [Lentinula edodes]
MVKFRGVLHSSWTVNLCRAQQTPHCQCMTPQKSNIIRFKHCRKIQTWTYIQNGSIDYFCPVVRISRFLGPRSNPIRDIVQTTNWGKGQPAYKISIIRFRASLQFLTYLPGSFMSMFNSAC